MSRGNHKKIKQLIAQKQKTITDRQFFVSRILAAHFADMAAVQTRRYGHRRKVKVRIVWEPKTPQIACTNNDLIWINAGHKCVTKYRMRAERYDYVCGLFTHELGHLLYTDFLVTQSHHISFEAGMWYPSVPSLLTKQERENEADILAWAKSTPERMQAMLRLMHSTHNILEDGYVEAKMLSRYPGVLGYSLGFMRDADFAELRTLTQLIEDEEDEGGHIWMTISQLMLSYVLWGELKYGEEPHSDERVQTVFSLIPVLDDAMLSEKPQERWAAVNTVFVRCWEYIKSFLEHCEELAKTATASGTGTTSSELLSQMLSALAGASAEAEGNTAPVAESVYAPVTSATSAGKRKATARIAAASSKKEAAEKTEPPESESTEGDAGSEPENKAGGPSAADMAKATSASPSSETGSTDGESGEAEAGGPALPDGKSCQNVADKETGRIPLEQTDDIYEPVGGSTTHDDEYSGTGYAGSASDIERLLENMAERAVHTQLENERIKELDELAKAVSYGDIHSGVEFKVHRIAEVSDEMKECYHEVAAPLLRISKQLQKSIAQQLQDRRRGGKQTSLLMGRRLDIHALPRNDGRVFYKTALPNEAPELAIGLLLDESGSMCSYDRSTYARASAIILYDFCRSMGIPAMVYGHSTSCGCVDLYSYAEFNTIDRDDAYRLMDISARGSNRDGAALRFVAEQLSKRQEEVKILILVSDGQPADAGYYGTAAEEDLRGIKQEYQRKGILLVAAAVGDDKVNLERIYGDSFLDITDLNKLPILLTDVVKRHIRV